jgi:hypothetical protein
MVHYALGSFLLSLMHFKDTVDHCYFCYIDYSLLLLLASCVCGRPPTFLLPFLLSLSLLSFHEIGFQCLPPASASASASAWPHSLSLSSFSSKKEAAEGKMDPVRVEKKEEMPANTQWQRQRRKRPADKKIGFFRLIDSSMQQWNCSSVLQ